MESERVSVPLGRFCLCPEIASTERNVIALRHPWRWSRNGLKVRLTMAIHSVLGVSWPRPSGMGARPSILVGRTGFQKSKVWQGADIFGRGDVAVLGALIGDLRGSTPHTSRCGMSHRAAHEDIEITSGSTPVNVLGGCTASGELSKKVGTNYWAW